MIESAGIDFGEFRKFWVGEKKRAAAVGAE